MHRPVAAAAALAWLCVVAGTASPARAQLDPAQIYAALGKSVGEVRFEGRLFNGEAEAGTGTAFLISADGYMITCRHVVPVFDNYESTTFKVRLGGPASTDVYDAKVVWFSEDSTDVAVIKIDLADGRPVTLSRSVPPFGSRVVVMGFPVNLDLNITDGLISGPGADGRLVMSTAINPGNSGGPVIGLNGEVVGVVWGAALRWRLNGQEIPTQGINFFYPISSVVAALPAQFPTPGPAPVVPAETPRQFLRAVEVDWTKDNHPAPWSNSREYSVRIEADPGFEIAGAQLGLLNESNATAPVLEISEDRKSVVVRSTLTSGSLFDRFRGQLQGTLQLNQTPAE